MSAFFRIWPDIGFEILNIFAVLENASQRLFDRFFIQDAAMKFKKGFSPVKGFGYTRPFHQVLFADILHENRNLMDKRFFQFRYPRLNDFHFLVQVRIIDPVIKTAPFEGVVDVAGSIGCNHDHGFLSGFQRADFRNRYLKIGQDFQ